MARIIRSQAQDAARIQAEKEATKEQEEKARVRLNELSEELEKKQEGLQQLSRSREEAEQDLEKFYEEEKKLLERLNVEKEKKQSELKRICEEEEKAKVELLGLHSEKVKLQNELRSAKGVAIPHFTRKIRSANQSDVEIERKPNIYRDNASLIILENSLFTKANVGDYVSYVGEGDSNTQKWRVWKKTDSSIIITPVLNDSCKQLKLSGIADYLDIVKNAVTHTDKINRACKEWYVNASLGITAENIRSMTIEDINEACGYNPPEITKRVAYYPTYTRVSGTTTYNGNTYTNRSHGEGYGETIFYTYDGGGVGKTGYNGDKYRAIERNNPVYVSNTYYCYDPSNYTHADNNSVTVGSILGSYHGWLASSCVSPLDNFAKFQAYFSNHNYVSARPLFFSDGDIRYESYGVRPLISLSSTFQAVGGDGSEDAPWQISR